MRHLSIATAIILGSATLVGCATSAQLTGPSADTKAAMLAEANKVWNELHNISIEARDELRLLAKAEQAQMQASLTREQHEQRFFQSTYVPEGFEQVLTFRYDGPISQAAKAIARIADYDIEFYGEPTPREPWVSIKLDKQPLINALHEVGMYSGEQILIEVLEATKTIKFTYRPR